MRILHVCLAAPFVDNMAYQENSLVYWHERMGHDVLVAASTEIIGADNVTISHAAPGAFKSDDGARIIRLKYSFGLKGYLARKLRMYVGFADVLKEFRPDLIFIHDLQFYNTNDVVEYCRDFPHTRVIVDCHADYSNSARSFLSRVFLHRLYYRWRGLKLNIVAERFFGVLPSRCLFLNDMYGVPLDKIELLEMGIDDRWLPSPSDLSVQNTEESRGSKIRLITGGKIDQFKTDVLNLMAAMNGFHNIHLTVFGSVSSEIAPLFFKLVESTVNIDFAGWVSPALTARYLSEADVGIFPGRHSVLWEQSVGLGLPLVIPEGSDMHHLDIGNNILEWQMTTKEGCVALLNHLCSSDLLKKMQISAGSEVRKRFYYSDIAKRSIS